MNTIKLFAACDLGLRTTERREEMILSALVSRQKLRYHDRMLKRNQNGGAASIVVISLLVVILGGAVAFGVWAYGSRQDYKNNVDAKITVAVTKAKQQQTITDNAEFAQANKSPLRAYNGPEAYGSVVAYFPKTWSAYIDDTGNGRALVDAYFAPNVVPSITSQASVFALRIQVINQSYSQVVKAFAGQEQSGTITSAQAYALPKVPKAIGVEITGKLPDNNTGTMVVLPLRSETVEIWTDGTQYIGDFNNFILTNFTFIP